MNLEYSPQEIKLMASQLLAGMLANPHIYPAVSDEKAGQQEQILVAKAIAIAESLMAKVDQQYGALVSSDTPK